MTKKLFLQSFSVLICAVCLLGYLSLDVSATEIENDPTQATEAEQETEPTVDNSSEEIYKELESLREDVASKQQIIENNQAMIERYHDLYSTWTGIIAALLTIFGVIVPLLSPIINRLNKRELKKDIDEFKAYRAMSNMTNWLKSKMRFHYQTKVISGVLISVLKNC